MTHLWTIHCGHSFCSGCLRSALATKQECPTCRKPANEGHIRPNYVVEDAISAWNEARGYVLGLISKANVAPESPRKRKRIHSQSPISVDMDESDPLPGPSKVSSSYSGTSASSLNPQPDDAVACPICSRQVPYRDLNNHIDRNCPDPSKGKAKVKKQRFSQCLVETHATGESKIQREIKDLLQQHQLSVQGDRATLEQRHKKWVMLYNANLDRSESNRKTQTTLRQELKKWEETMSKRKKTVVDDPKEHARRHKSEFDRLIQMARPPKKDTTSSSPAPPPVTSDDADGSSTRERSTPGGSEDAIVIDDE
ncbi:hypothetical protein FA13DRAFT_1822212 [Coprinellus micaceus]|uniref:RING-type domain-containing protein n=1 Tax=Coprinellus micaceus TaxID=71717 RepID=A0A4Y7S9L0_COPMI|nr:hypothetical protein FA13DRAFT_1822212 [Coprinellus micaceus]